ncbi:MAG: hypothetical protein ACE148_08380 [Vicinamibacterales bacterium]
MPRFLVLPLFVCVLTARAGAAQGPLPPVPPTAGTPADSAALTIFLDCRTGCWSDYVKTEVAFLDYINVREKADVHVLVTARGTAAGGTEYTLQFTGQTRFAGVDDEVVFTTLPNESDENRRRTFVETLKLGLVRYAIHTELGRSLRISQSREGTAPRRPGEARSATDPWNYWVMRARLNVAADSETSNTADRFESSFSVNRTTDQWKINLSGSQDYRETEYTFSDGTKRLYVRRSVSTAGSLIKSLTDHWSAGARAGWSSTTYENRRSSAGTAAAVEYNVFRYADSTRQQLTFQYRLGVSSNEYYAETIYGKLAETVPYHALRSSFDLRKTWGSVSSDLEMSQYLHDKSLNRKTLSAQADIRLFRGFSLNVEAEASSIHDQIYLLKGDATDEEVLVRQRQLATSFRRSFRFGFSYTFGSIFSNVVNTRVGNF